MSLKLVPLGTEELTREEYFARRDEIIEDMNAELRRVKEGIDKWLVRNVECGLRRTWNLGRVLKRVHDREKRYGPKPIERLTAVVECDKSLLQKAMRFYTSFPTKKELDRLLSMRMKITGEPVTYTHVEKLTTVDDKARRDRLLQECVENDWTAEELAYHIRVMCREETGNPRLPHAGGRPPKIPKSIVQLTDNYEKTVGTLVRNEPLMYNHPLVNFIRYVNDLPSDKVTPELLAKLDACVEITTTAMRLLTGLTPHLMEARSLAERKMNAQARDSGVADADVIHVKAEPAGGKQNLLGSKTGT